METIGQGNNKLFNFKKLIKIFILLKGVMVKWNFVKIKN